MDRPEYFIVRVYRRAPEDPGLEGVVEVIATLKQQSFTASINSGPSCAIRLWHNSGRPMLDAPAIRDTN
ncbi:MAG TPA: hypothetical protein VFA81_07225 [Burkholderiales bacterium]|nr:hypothetical protein [Burkholderiales bacterium]